MAFRKPDELMVLLRLGRDAVSCRMLTCMPVWGCVGSKLTRQGASNHQHTPYYLTHGWCSSGFFSMALTTRPKLNIDLLSGGILRTVNLHARG